MKALTIFVFILAFFSQDTMAALFGPDKIPYRQICNNIHDTFNASPTSEICNEVISQYEGVPPFVYNTCEGVVSRYIANPEGAKDFCISELKDIRQEDTPIDLGVGPLQSRNGTGHAPLQVHQSLAMGYCGQNSVDDFTCRIDSDLVSPELSNVLASVRTLPISTPVSEQNFSQAACNCLEDSLEAAHNGQNKTINTAESSLTKERERINDLIFNAAGKKLINDFASNFEDINFYLTNNVTAIGGSANSDLQCNDFAAIQAKVNETCGRNGVAQGIRTERMTSLLNAFGDFNNESSPENIFNQLQHNIMNYQLDPSRVFPGRSGTFTRQDYDRFRYGHYKSQPQVTFVNDITDKLLDDSVLGPRILQEIENGKKPGHAIFEILRDETNPDNRRILNQFLEDKKNTAFYGNLLTVLNSQNPDDLKTTIITAFDMATDMHPSLKAVLKDKNLFFSIREKMHISGNHSLIETLDSSEGHLASYFREKCEKIKNDFAAAICVPNDDFLALTNRDDLNRLLSTVHDQLNPALKDLLLCRMPETPAAPGIFTRLAFNMGDKFSVADYYLMKVNPKEESASRFTRLAYGFQGSDAKTFRELSQIAESGDEFRVPATSQSEEVATTEVATMNEGSSLTSLTQNSNESLERNLPEAPVTNYIPSVLPQTPVSSETRENSTDARAALRDFLANKENEAEVDQLLNQTSSKDHEELLRLRQELATNRSRLMELFQENEQRKLAALQENYRNLEKEVTQDAAPPVREVSPASSQTAGGVQASAAIADSVMVPRNTGSSVVSATSAGSAGGTSGTSSGIGRTIASAENETDFNDFNTDGGAIIIEAGTIQANSQAAREDINAEVISYLQDNQPDIATLKQLKESGVILKFRVLENGREILKEMRVEYALLSPEARQLLERKITQQERTQELNTARRAYSFSALKHLLGIRSQSQN